MSKFCVEEYLKRIGFLGEPKIDVKTLSELQYRHFLTVPYENIDIVRGVPLSLDIDDLYEKIVTRRRGGYCFELNALFNHLLVQIGFKTTSYISRFLLGEEQIPMRRHRVMKVEISGEYYIADVGVGVDVPILPMKIVENEIATIMGTTYRLKSQPFLGWVLYKQKGDDWLPIYSFTQEEQLEVDFIQPDFYCQHHPQSIFNKTNIVALKTETGRYTLDDRTFKIFDGSGVSVTEYEASEIDSVLEKYFGIVIS